MLLVRLSNILAAITAHPDAESLDMIMMDERFCQSALVQLNESWSRRDEEGDCKDGYLLRIKVDVREISIFD